MKPYPIQLEISGPFRPETRVCEIENHELPTLLRMVFDQTASFSQNFPKIDRAMNSKQLLAHPEQGPASHPARGL